LEHEKQLQYLVNNKEDNDELMRMVESEDSDIGEKVLKVSKNDTNDQGNGEGDSYMFDTYDIENSKATDTGVRDTDGVNSNDDRSSNDKLATPTHKLDAQPSPPSIRNEKKNRHISQQVDDVLQRPLIVIIRHGKTEHNKLGLFTGWEDAPLAVEGRNEALFAGQLLKAHGIQFDVVYTSWLSRAIETAWMVVNELEDSLWVPIVKTWRLNERMYGALTGLSKKMIRQRHGVTKFLEWRRSFDIPPPAISSFSHAYPGNDERYMNYVQDLPISIFESLIRSLAHGKPEIHRQFPKAESLKMCMERTIPYFKDVIVPQSINKRKSVLIASSENAIRGLLMHLCDIPIDRIHQVIYIYIFVYLCIYVCMIVPLTHAHTPNPYLYI
jgi:2,3-bisphosphoglycerate-dependent phosphoglycerate mutase